MSETVSTRREFLQNALVAGGGLVLAGRLGRLPLLAGEANAGMKFGMVTYLWGQDWDLPVLLGNCRKAGIAGVELRTEHAHGVESSLTAAERTTVKQRFADSGITLVGLGTNYAFHWPDGDRLKQEIEGAKAYVRLSHDCGGSGVKVKPNDLPKGVPYAKTIEQIGESLNEIGEFAEAYGQEIRVEVHGGCSQLPVMKAIMQAADHANVTLCWNSNAEDLEGQGLGQNFDLVRPYFGQIVHVRELNVGDYPYQELVNLLVWSSYTGWVLLEARTQPSDRVEAMAAQKALWQTMVAQAVASEAAGEQGVTLTQNDQAVTVEIDGRPFTEYRFADVPRPYFYPVIGPTGAGVMRHWPMADGPNEEHDHPHHKSLWFTHGNVNGVDFWLDGDDKGRIVHEKFLEVRSGRQGVIRSQNNWIAPGGETVCTDTRTYRFSRGPEERILDFEVTIHASHGRVMFGDTKEGTMAIRLTPTMRLDGEVGQGHIVNSEGQRDGDTWGKRAAWCDYYGPVDGQVVGVAIFDHPDNARHPTWWHVRDYGLFAANPFGVHDFERKPAGTGDYVIEAGQSVTFRWRFLFHEGDETQGRVAEHYRRYADG